jgi:hypothetical protein
MRRIAQTNAKPPIGISTKTKGTASATMSHQLDISVIEPQPRPRIWNNLAPETPRSEAQSSMMLLTDDSDSTSSSMMSSTQLWWEGTAFMLHHSCTCNNRLVITPCACYSLARYQITRQIRRKHRGTFCQQFEQNRRKISRVGDQQSFY